MAMKVTTAAAWKTAKRHTVTLPSSAVVEIEIPDLPQLVKAGQIPNELVEVAIGAAASNKVTKEDVGLYADFANKLVSLTVVNPKVTEEEAAAALPFEDKEMIVDFATRKIDMDAVGHHLGGLEKSKDFRSFRGIFRLDEDVAD